MTSIRMTSTETISNEVTTKTKHVTIKVYANAIKGVLKAIDIAVEESTIKQLLSDSIGIATIHGWLLAKGYQLAQIDAFIETIQDDDKYVLDLLALLK